MELIPNHNNDFFHRHPGFESWRRIIGKDDKSVFFINLIPRKKNYHCDLTMTLYHPLYIVRTPLYTIDFERDCFKGVEPQIASGIEEVYGKELGNILFNCDFGLSDPSIVEKLNAWFDDSSDLRIHGIPAVYLFNDNEIFTKKIRDNINLYTLPQVKLTMDAILKAE